MVVRGKLVELVKSLGMNGMHSDFEGNIGGKLPGHLP